MWNGISCYDQLQFTFWKSDLDGSIISSGFFTFHLFPRHSTRYFGPEISLVGQVNRSSECPNLDASAGHDFEQYYPMVEHWLTTCHSQHLCQDDLAGGIPEISWLPTRLIDVGCLETAEEPRLVVSEHNDFIIQASSTGRTPYFTLSHRWALGQMPILTTSNIENYKTRLPLEILPKTFIDAIDITRRLGSKYLWIDCLCILQDSVYDWEQESLLMEKVYSMCMCNLAASGASSGSLSLYGALGKSIDPFNLEERLIECNWNVAAGMSEREFYLMRNNLWTFGVNDSPLHARGWVLQERLLAPRTIHFGQERLFWECRELSACSIRNGTRLSELSWSEERIERLNGKSPILKCWLQNLYKRKKEYLLDYNLRNLYEPWRSIISGYAKTSLTQDGDRLIALSGVANSFQTILQDEYLAGLWRKTILYDLAWTVIDSSISKRPAAYIGPSWSWASINASPHGISTIVIPEHPHEMHPVAEIIDVKVEALGNEGVGQVKSAYLKARGFLLPIVRHQESQEPYLFDMEDEALIGFRPCIDVTLLNTEEDRLFCLHLFVNSGAWSQGSFFLAGIILRRTKQHERQEYVRVGMFHFPLAHTGNYYRLLHKICQVKGEHSQFQVVTIV